MMENVEDRIRARAHLIWEREGRPIGREFAHWEMAAAELAAEMEGEAAGNAAADAVPKPRAARKPKPAPAEGDAAPAPKRRAAAKPKAAG